MSERTPIRYVRSGARGEVRETARCLPVRVPLAIRPVGGAEVMGVGCALRRYKPGTLAYLEPEPGADPDPPWPLVRLGPEAEPPAEPEPAGELLTATVIEPAERAGLVFGLIRDKLGYWFWYRSDGGPSIPVDPHTKGGALVRLLADAPAGLLTRFEVLDPTPGGLSGTWERPGTAEGERWLRALLAAQAGEGDQ